MTPPPLDALADDDLHPDDRADRSGAGLVTLYAFAVLGLGPPLGAGMFLLKQVLTSDSFDRGVRITFAVIVFGLLTTFVTIAWRQLSRANRIEINES